MKSSNKWIIVLILAVVMLCCVMICCVGAIGVAVWSEDSDFDTSDFLQLDPDSSFLPQDLIGTQEPTPVVEFNQSQLDAGGYETLDTLKQEIVPINDPLELAERLKALDNIAATSPNPAVELQVGARQDFWVSDSDTDDTFSVSTILESKSDHVYFWIEDGVNFDQSDLDELVMTFEGQIYPTNRAFFGSEWRPGIDNDDHLYIVLARGIGSGIAGYFSSVDSLPREVFKYSNEHEMFVLNADNIILDEDFTYGVLAHEFQHMIHWYQDRNEEGWLNEGFSELAAFINGYDVGGFDYVYISDPDLQLNDWPVDGDATTPHYGASFLFVTYFQDRFGEDATKALVANPDNGMDSVDQVLGTLGEVDPLTGMPYSADDVFADWAVTNYLLNPAVGDGRYAYPSYDDAVQAYDTEIVSDCDGSWNGRSVHQYGVDYIRFTCPGTYQLTFEGENTADVIPVDAYSGSYGFWSNKGDQSDMTLTRSFDFSGVDGPINLQYSIWYDIEENYDYVYLLASEDGEDWQIIKTPSSTSEDPTGNSYGWGYSGMSSGWQQESVDLSQYAGQTVQIRFEYVTDAAVNGEGTYLDDISIPAIDYFEDFESGDGGWDGEGFVRIENSLPQTFKVSLIRSGSPTAVETLDVVPGQVLSLPVEIGGDVDDVTLVVSGTTRFTRQPATYRFKITAP